MDNNIYNYKTPKSSNEETRFFNIKGRINRKSFILRWLLSFGIFVIFTFSYYLGFLEILGIRIFYFFETIYFYILPLFISIFNLIQGVKRMHDVNKSGWYFFIPLYNIYLTFSAGTKGNNDYGIDPSPKKNIQFFDEIESNKQDVKEEAKGEGIDPNERDELFEDAARLIVNQQTGSISLIQSNLKLGYNRASRLMDQLEDAGIVGPSRGSKPRNVNIPDDYALEKHRTNSSPTHIFLKKIYKPVLNVTFYLAIGFLGFLVYQIAIGKTSLNELMQLSNIYDSKEYEILLPDIDEEIEAEEEVEEMTDDSDDNGDNGDNDKLTGRHALSLQWISWDYPGYVDFVKTDDNTYSISGYQDVYELEEGDCDGCYMKIHGVIKKITDKELQFTGTIESSVDYVQDGLPCKQYYSGTTFKSTQGRKYWRLQDMDGCDGVTNYVDIYF